MAPSLPLAQSPFHNSVLYSIWPILPPKRIVKVTIDYSQHSQQRGKTPRKTILLNSTGIWCSFSIFTQHSRSYSYAFVRMLVYWFGWLVNFGWYVCARDLGTVVYHVIVPRKRLMTWAKIAVAWESRACMCECVCKTKKKKVCLYVAHPHWYVTHTNAQLDKHVGFPFYASLVPCKLKRFTPCVLFRCSQNLSP